MYICSPSSYYLKHLLFALQFSYCNFGWTLHSADMNEDKKLDLVVGSPYAPGGGKQRGLVAAFYASGRRSQTGDGSPFHFGHMNAYMNTYLYITSSPDMVLRCRLDLDFKYAIIFSKALYGNLVTGMFFPRQFICGRSWLEYFWGTQLCLVWLFHS